MGSQIWAKDPQGRRTRLVWLDRWGIVVGGAIRYLELNDSGTGPGTLTQGIVTEAGTLLHELYDPLLDDLRADGHAVFPFGWDWRYSLRRDAPALADLIRTLFGHSSCVIVAHSAGGLVARLAMAALDATGQLGLVSRLITVGTPHYGAWFPVQALCRQAPVYQQLVGWVGRPSQDAISPDAGLDAVLTSFPSAFELMPFRDYGPDHDSQPDAVASLYRNHAWDGIEQPVVQPLLDAAVVTQTALRSASYPSRTGYVYGNGRDTPKTVITGPQSQQIWRTVGGGDGDDSILTSSAVELLGTRTVATSGHHQDLPTVPDGRRAIKSLLPSP